jgi:uncharacterized protein (DUF1800 family)
MKHNKEADLMAHLFRRAGFGATGEELRAAGKKGYAATVEELLHPENSPPGWENEDIVRRYHAGQNSLFMLSSAQTNWLYRMVHTRRPLEEKIALFWHGVFATGYTKLNQPKQILNQVDMFRRYGLGTFHRLLLHLSQDPAMIFWLDNKDNHRNAVNENFGRELLELFSMGVGNYNETDVRQVSHAFSGWTIRNSALHTARVAQDSVEPYGRLDWQFEYRDDDHDHSEKSFLGERGSFNGEDIIDIICRQEATARFLSRHLYNFFVADEPRVSAWHTVLPRDPAAIRILTDAYYDSGYEIRAILRALFNSEFFKEAAFQRVKSPTELVVGVSRLAGSYRFPGIEDMELGVATGLMGQQLLDPPSVEGWHTGIEWITTASLAERVNFASDQFADLEKPGVSYIFNQLKAMGDTISPEQLVDSCLDLMGPISVSASTREVLMASAEAGGAVRFGTEPEDKLAAERVKEVLQLIVSAPEFQLA